MNTLDFPRLMPLVGLCALAFACKTQDPKQNPKQQDAKQNPTQDPEAKVKEGDEQPEPATEVEPDKPPPINPVVKDCNITSPDTPVTKALLASGLPCSVIVTEPITLDHLQQNFDYHSWLVFLALNAPQAGGVIGSGSAPGGDAPAVWEAWREISDVMRPGGQAPPGWDAPRDLPEACKKLGADGGKRVIRMVGKTPDLLNEFDQPFDTGPLIDQHGEYVRYEILINRPMFEYIVQNQLYSKAGQAAFTEPIAFPEGKVDEGTVGTVGAIMVKAAWKQIDGSEEATSFHTTEAFVYTPPSDNPKIEESCSVQTMALVGLHVAQKTKNEPQWVWSTYEQVDNVPSEAEIEAGKLRDHYNFYKPGCAPADCPVNEPPPRPWDPNAAPLDYASQIVRVISLTEEVEKLNGEYQGLLEGTVWQHYMLVSTQWPTDATSPTNPNGVPAPTYLANTTMETYVQGAVPQSSSSCMECHGNAAATSGRDSDFTYILERAQ